MEYGEKLYRGRWYLIPNYKQDHFVFRYRIDPVPFVHKRHSSFKNWYKTPKTRNERKQWDKKYGRLKRSPRNLPNAWDDYPRADVRIKRSWKKNSKCRKQYGDSRQTG